MTVSYAQRGEDTRLWSFFEGKTDGHYIDIGANDPIVDSVSKSFYDAGWRGINVEPLHVCADALCFHQPDSLNVRVALGEKSDTMTLFYDKNRLGLSTLDERNAATLGLSNTTAVPVWTLAQLCRSFVKWPIDWLNIDVEGWEEQVIRGGDWEKFRPTIVVVEATKPTTDIPSHEEWEQLLFEVDYEFLFFDGLNRFYKDAHA